MTPARPAQTESLPRFVCVSSGGLPSPDKIESILSYLILSDKIRLSYLMYPSPVLPLGPLVIASCLCSEKTTDSRTDLPRPIRNSSYGPRQSRSPLVGRKCRPPLATRLPSSPFIKTSHFKRLPIPLSNSSTEQGFPRLNLFDLFAARAVLSHLHGANTRIIIGGHRHLASRGGRQSKNTRPPPLEV
jgi:hypothetical protein